MSHAVESASRWLYRGVWGALVRCFHVPDEPPTLPVRAGEQARSFQPAPGFLRYLKFYFWLVLLPMDGALIGAWIIILVNSRFWGLVLAVPFWAVAILPDIFAYIAIHLRYDTTWYVMTGRSIRTRRGIWIIKEVSITFENVQNVRVSQGPVQRSFGIADVIIETAGAGSAGGGPGGVANEGRIEGVADAPAIRDQVMQRVRRSRSAGLGDEKEPMPPRTGWTPDHVAVLREIRDALVTT